MKRALKYIILLVFGFLWFLGCSKETVVFLDEQGWIKDEFRYGDLYRLSNLQQYKELSPKCKLPYQGKRAEATLYLAGDSFTEEERVAPDEYASQNYFRIFVADSLQTYLPVSGRKILIIQTVERHLRERFSEKPWDNWQLVKESSEGNPVKEKTTLSSIFRGLMDFKVPYREDMHESVLFSPDWILWIKEKKAAFNYKVLGKIDPKVKIVDGQLVYSLDVDPGISSVFDPVEDAEIERIVKHANQTRENYLKLGFDEVYLSIIPNKTSCVVKDSTSYNHLLQRVENHPELKMPVISVWDEFSAENYYQKGDSHWNCEGQKIWVDKVNRLILAGQPILSTQ